MFDTDGGTAQPCICFICEHSFEPGEPAVATGWNYEPDYPSRLFGHKLVCDNCIAALAEHRGYVAQIELLKAKDVARLYEKRAERLQAQLDEGVAGLVKLLDERRAAEKPKTTTARKTSGAMTLGH